MQDKLTASGTGPPGLFEWRTDAVLAGVPVPVRLGAMAWGQLSAARDNAVLVCHYYTGTMRAAGRNPDGTPAWWDALIGPGRAIDTNRFYVVCLNTLSNVQALDAEVVTTGPDTPGPDGQPWGERFPAWDFADLHALQEAFMRSLGVQRWHAVVGPSLGGMQALQWAARTPHLAPRVAAVVTSPGAGPALQDAFGPLLRDVARGGNVTGALRLISLFGLGGDGLELQFRDARFDTYLRVRAAACSLNHILDIGRAVGTHDVTAVAPQEELFARWRALGTQLLTVNVTVDQFFPVAEMRRFAQASQAASVAHTHVEFDSLYGHLGGLQDTRKFAPALRELLESPLPARPALEEVHV